MTGRIVADGAAGAMADRVAGVDGCPAGWVAVYRDPTGARPPERRLHRRFGEILETGPRIVAVDMPIGLPDRVGPGGRGPESAVRPFLGARQSSVFSVPSRAAVEAGIGPADREAYAAACAAALGTSDPPRKISKQCFHLFPKIREIDALMTPAMAARVFEVHPEFAFWRLNGERAMALPKKVKSRPHPDGLAERIHLLARHGYDRAFLEGPRPPGVGPDDLIDAAVVAVIAERLFRGAARPYPDPPGRDGKGLAVAIWA